MKKPVPQELVIEDISSGKLDRVIKFTWSTENAKTWAETAAPEFGNTIDPQLGVYAGKSLWLFVAPNYVFADVLAYLREVWAEQQAPAEWPEELKA